MFPTFSAGVTYIPFIQFAELIMKKKNVHSLIKSLSEDPEADKMLYLYHLAFHYVLASNDEEMLLIVQEADYFFNNKTRNILFYVRRL